MQTYLTVPQTWCPGATLLCGELDSGRQAYHSEGVLDKEDLPEIDSFVQAAFKDLGRKLIPSRNLRCTRNALPPVKDLIEHWSLAPILGQHGVVPKSRSGQHAIPSRAVPMTLLSLSSRKQHRLFLGSAKSF
jgi:hypothetical protein